MNFSATFDSYLPQQFSLPSTIIHQISRKPSTIQVYQNLVKTCKYFFANYPIISLSCLHFPTPIDHSLFTCLTDECCLTSGYYKTRCQKVNSAKDKQRYWLSSGFFVNAHTHSEMNITSKLIPKLVHFNIQKFSIYNQNIFFHELLHFAPLVKDLNLSYNKILHDDGTVAQIENILAVFTKITSLWYTFQENTEELSSKSVSKIVKLEHLKNLSTFHFADVPGTFDFETFVEFMMNNQHIQFGLYFCNPISANFVQRLQQFSRSIEHNMFQGTSHPKIEYPFIDDE